MPSVQAILRLTLVFTVVCMRVDAAFACSMGDAVAATKNAIIFSGYYWIGTGVIGAAVICLEIYRKRWSLILPVCLGLLVFHPRWTVLPAYGPDCAFANVEASQYVLVVICLLLGYQIIRIVRSNKKPANG